MWSWMSHKIKAQRGHTRMRRPGEGRAEISAMGPRLSQSCNLQKLERSKRGPGREHDLDDHHDFGPLRSGTERDYISIVLGHRVRGDWYSAHRIQFRWEVS